MHQVSYCNQSQQYTALFSSMELQDCVEQRYFYQTGQCGKRVNTANPLGPWQPLENIELQHIAVIEDQSELPGTIRQAEEYVLTPKDANGNQISETPGTFSPNTIKIDVFCDCPNLSFVDLPGAIQAAGTLNDKLLPTYNVDIVRSLATRYAKDTNNIMLLMLPMNHGMVSMTSFRIIREQNAQSRTVAVITKPDRVLLDEQHENLHAFFSDTTTHEFMGHHMVMLGDSDGLTEDDFFSKESFASVSEGFQRQFGVGRLTERLRDIFFAKITQSLPGNLQKIESTLSRVKGELDSMPAPPDMNVLPFDLREHLLRFTGVIRTVLAPSKQGQENLSIRSQSLRLMKQICQQNPQQCSNDDPPDARRISTKD